MTLNASQLENALRLVGKGLARDGQAGKVRLYVVGGTAGLLSGWLSDARSTGDVDVAEAEPGDSWDAISRAATEVATALELPGRWLNNECRMYTWCLPLGWKGRCEVAATYGPLEIWLLGRRDFIAAKVVSAPSRPQDLEDLLAMEPTSEELAFTEEHIERLVRESLDTDQLFEDARSILQSLRSET